MIEVDQSVFRRRKVCAKAHCITNMIFQYKISYIDYELQPNCKLMLFVGSNCFKMGYWRDTINYGFDSFAPLTHFKTVWALKLKSM